jgi:hypothetical protein
LLRLFPTERETGLVEPLLSMYVEAAALPFCAPNASVTTSVLSLAKAQP